MKNNSRLFLSTNDSHSNIRHWLSEHICCYVNYIISHRSHLCQYCSFHSKICSTFNFFYSTHRFDGSFCCCSSFYYITNNRNKSNNTKTKTNKWLRSTYISSIDISSSNKLFSCHTDIIDTWHNISSRDHTNKSHTSIKSIESCFFHFSLCHLISNCAGSTCYSYPSESSIYHLHSFLSSRSLPKWFYTSNRTLWSS